MAVVDVNVFPGFLTPVLKQLFFPKPPTNFVIYFSRGVRRKYAKKKISLNWVSNSQPPGHESDTLTTEPPRRGKTISSVITDYCFNDGITAVGLKTDRLKAQVKERKGTLIATKIYRICHELTAEIKFY